MLSQSGAAINRRNSLFIFYNITNFTGHANLIFIIVVFMFFVLIVPYPGNTSPVKNLHVSMLLKIQNIYRLVTKDIARKIIVTPTMGDNFWETTFRNVKAVS